MALEMLAMAWIAVTGAVLLRALGMRGWVLAPLGYVIGLAMQVIVSFFVVLVASPWALALLWVVPAAAAAVAWVRAARSGDLVTRDMWWPAGAALATALLAGAARASQLFTFHPDSFVLTNIAAVMARGELLDVVSSYLMIKRPFGYSAVHASAVAVGEHAWTSVAPLTAMATIGVAWWMAQRAHRASHGRLPLALAALALVVLVTSNRFVFHAFYLNAHMLLAAFALVTAACSWLIVRGRPPIASGALAAVAGMSAAAAALLRPDGGLFAAIAMAGLLVSQSVSWRDKAAAAGPLVVAIGAYNTLAFISLVAAGGNYLATGPQFVVGIGIGVLVLVQRWWPRITTSRAMPLVLEIGPWAVAVLASLWRPGIARDNADAVWKNFVLDSAYWGRSAVIVAVLVVAAAVVLRSREAWMLRLSATTLLPVAWVLSVVRSGEYRPGPYDSLARMAVHALIFGAVYVAVVLAQDDWRSLRRAAARGDAS